MARFVGRGELQLLVGGTSKSSKNKQLWGEHTGIEKDLIMIKAKEQVGHYCKMKLEKWEGSGWIIKTS